MTEKYCKDDRQEPICLTNREKMASTADMQVHKS